MMRKQMEEILINLLSCGIFEVIKNFIMKLQQRKQAAGRGEAVIQPAILPRTGRPEEQFSAVWEQVCMLRSRTVWLAQTAQTDLFCRVDAAPG